MRYQQLLRDDQRLLVLRGLQEMQGYTANDSIIHTVLEQYGHQISRDQVRTHLSWLSEQGMVEIETIGDTLVATLTIAGSDVATGRSTVAGIKRPSPKR
ncbi:MAG: ArsR family transcriptional regulator [Pseudomonadota bacterium]